MSESKQKFYVTTPIYYVNARPHIGHAYTTIVADVLARGHRLQGDDTFFLTGTDEHGQKIERSAAAAGIPPQQFADEVSAQFLTLWDRMGLTYDRYIRTTDERHKVGVQKLFRELYDRGFIYLDKYTGAYCVSDEAFVDVNPGEPCPDCGRITEIVTEENFFFKLSAFQLPLLDLIESGELKIENESRRNEVLSFLRGNIAAVQQHFGVAAGFSPRKETFEEHGASAPGLSTTSAGTAYVPGALKDLSVSRSSFTWGIPVPEDVQRKAGATQKHVVYVWLDALANYMTAIGYGSNKPVDEEEFKKFWPADLHLVGKEIIRFHCVYWPAFLLAAGLPLPKTITAHGWLLFDNAKMSKSKGNIVRAETILEAFGEHVYAKQFPQSTKSERDLFASDVLRYFLLREIPFGQDGSFSFDAMVTRYNAELTNGYGNLISRTLNLLQQNFADGIEQPQEPWICADRQFGFEEEIPQSIREAYSGTAAVIREMVNTPADVDYYVSSNRFHLVVGELANRITLVDGYISWHKPWLLAKDSGSAPHRDTLVEVLYTAAESIRIITALLYPILPYSTARVWQQLGLGDIEEAVRNGELNNLQWGGLQPGTKLGPLGPIFPRADKGLVDIMIDMENERTAAASGASNETPPTPRPDAPLKSAATPAHAAPVSADPTHPAAPPRALDSLAEPSGTLPVGGSSAVTTERVHTPHADAQPSGVFASQASQASIAGGPADASLQSQQITIDDFAKVELRVAQILVAERIPKADKLLRLEVDLGYEKRQILSGIAEWYAAEDLIGRRIVVITNLAPRKMRGLESHGMLLAASEGEGGKPVLATFGEDIALGSRLK